MSRRPPPTSRRELLVLGGLLGTASAVIMAARRLAPVGPDVGTNAIVADILNDTEAPVGGNVEGDVSLIVWTDFNCAACRKAHPNMMTAVQADRRTRLVFRDWPIMGPDSEASAMLAIAAGWQEPGLYQRIHSGLMLAGERATRHSTEAMIQILGGDAVRAREDVANYNIRLAGMLSRHAMEGFMLGLGGTPGHLVGTLLVKGVRSQREFGRAIEQARRKAN